MVFFTWAGFDEIDEVAGAGSVELLDDGSIEVTFAYQNGDEAIPQSQTRYLFNSLLDPSVDLLEAPRLTGDQTLDLGDVCA